MVYLTPDAGKALGLLLKEIGCQTAELTLTSDSLTLKVGLAPGVASQSIADSSNKRKYRQPITFNGESLTTSEWARKLGVAKSVIKYRMKKYNSPYGRGKPTDEDSVIVETDYPDGQDIGQEDSPEMNENAEA